MSGDIPIKEPSHPRRPRNYEMPVSPVTNSQSDETLLISQQGNYDFDENYKARSIPRYHNIPSNGHSNPEPIEEYDGPPEYTEIDEQQTSLDYSEINDSEPVSLQREHSEIDNEFDKHGGYVAIPQEFKAPPPSKQAPTLNGKDLTSDVFETLNASDLDTTGTPGWRMRSRTFTTPPKEEYETPIDATTNATGVRGQRANTLQHPPPPSAPPAQPLLDYETPIDAAF